MAGCSDLMNTESLGKDQHAGSDRANYHLEPQDQEYDYDHDLNFAVSWFQSCSVQEPPMSNKIQNTFKQRALNIQVNPQRDS